MSSVKTKLYYWLLTFYIPELLYPKKLEIPEQFPQINKFSQHKQNTFQSNDTKKLLEEFYFQC